MMTHINEITIPQISPENNNISLDKKIVSQKDLSAEEQQFNIEKIKLHGEELFNQGAYFEAIKNFEQAKFILNKQGREEEEFLLSELIESIKKLVKEREERIELLEEEKINGNSIRIFELYSEIIDISKSLKDFEFVDMFKSEIIDFYDANKIKLLEIQRYRTTLEEQAEIMLNSNLYEKTFNCFEMCEQISELLVNFNKNEIINVEKFYNKKLLLSEKIKNK